MGSRAKSRRREIPHGDFVARAIAYAEACADPKAPNVGKWLRLGCRRFLADLKHAKAKRPAFRFDPDWANRACAFIELLPHVEGRWETPTIRIHPSHMLLVVQLFGFRNLDGGRRFTSALLCIGRKNAKSLIAAAILLVVYCLEEEQGPQIVTAATTGSQARMVWKAAAGMVNMTPMLRESFKLKAWANSISNYSNGGSFKPINSRASNQDGLNPSAACLDEIHAHKSHDLLNVIKSGAGARRDPLFLYTTTEGYETPGPWPELRHFAKQILEGVVEADHFLALYFAVDDDDDDFDPEAWKKANPLWDVNPILAREIAKEAIEARAMPGKLAEFRIKRLNRPSSSATAIIDLRLWNRCDGAIDLDRLREFPCWAAFDLSSTIDLTAWRLVWRVNGRWYTWGRRWVPADTVNHRTQTGAASYAGWVADGAIEQTPGNVIDYTIIERAIREDCARFRPEKIAFDPWNAKDLAQRLTEDGFPLVEFVQGAKSYNAPMKELQAAYRGGALAHGGDKVLRWCASNLVPRYDANMNEAPDKRRAPEKIDDMVALLMAMGVALVNTNEGDMSDFLSNPVVAQ